MRYFSANKLKSLFLLAVLSCSNAQLLAMDLNGAVHAALRNAPEIRKTIANQNKLSQEAIADSQLPDPMFTAGIMNLPTDSFDFDQEPMTQIQIGLQQSFPKGRSLKYSREKKEHLALATKQFEETLKLQITKNVRLAWFELLFWQKVLEKTNEQKKVFADLLDVTESLLANNKAQQHDVIRAQLELSELDVRITEVEKNIDVAKANLLRWIGQEYRGQSYSSLYPTLPQLAEFKDLQIQLHEHPILAADNATIASAKSNLKWACEQYKPGFTTGLAYGFRQGRNIDDSRRADFVSMNVKMDLPFFRANRQDRRVLASKESLVETQEKQDIDHKELLRTLEEEYSKWKQFSSNLTLYTNKLGPQAKQYSQATMLAYRNGNSDFATVARSYVRELDTMIATVKTRIDRDKAHINLLYLMGNRENA